MMGGLGRMHAGRLAEILILQHAEKEITPTIPASPRCCCSGRATTPRGERIRSESRLMISTLSRDECS